MRIGNFERFFRRLETADLVSRRDIRSSLHTPNEMTSNQITNLARCGGGNENASERLYALTR